MGKTLCFPYLGPPSLSLPRNNRTLGQGQEAKFIFIVEATLTDISVPLSKGREHTDYITAPRAAQGWAGPGDHAGGEVHSVGVRRQRSRLTGVYTVFI